MVARGAAKSKVSALPKNASFRADDRRERERETDDDFVVNRSASKVEAGVAPNQTLVIEVVKGPSKGKVYRAGPNQKQLSVGRTKASLVHVKSPGVSEKHAEVSNCERRHSSRPHEVLALSAR